VAKYQTLLSDGHILAPLKEPSLNKSAQHLSPMRSYSNVSSEPEAGDEVDMARQRQEEEDRLQRQATALTARSSRRFSTSGTTVTVMEQREASAERAEAERPRLAVAIRDATKAVGSVEVGARGTVRQGRGVPGLGHLVKLDDGGAVWVKPEGLWRVVWREAPSAPEPPAAADPWGRTMWGTCAGCAVEDGVAEAIEV